MKQDFTFIFDMDGVLILSSEIHNRAFQEALAGEAVKLHSYQSISGMRTDTAFEYLFRQYDAKLSETKKQKLVKLKQQIARKLLSEKFPMAPGCPEVLFELRSRGFELALASSSSRYNVDLFLKNSGAESVFSVILSGEDVTHAKPHPEIFIKAAEGLSRPVENCIVIEDSESGITAAKRAGTRVIGFSAEGNGHDLLEKGAQLILGQIKDLLSLKWTKGGFILEELSG